MSNTIGAYHRVTLGRRRFVADLVRNLSVLALLIFSSVNAAAQDASPGPGRSIAPFAGSQSCVTCHEAEAADWRRSHHALAMQDASDATMLGRFDGTSYEKDGVESVFSKKGGAFFVHTEGPDGKLADFEIKYAFGVYPLQQYLIELSGGRLQAFGVAWDARPIEQGGQRWFGLYPGQKLAAGDPLHWTGLDQNWNYQCAWCHSTNLTKNYDPDSGGFHTTWSEISVGCEACHGRGSEHVARAAQAAGAPMPDHGFVVRFDERKGAQWAMNEAGQAVRATPKTTSKEILVCAGCHARRSQFSSDPAKVASFYDAFRPSLLEAPLYHVDGQQRAEVYNFGSFLQSRMYAAGVTCSDCHNPHSGKLRAEGDAVCAHCHAPERFAQTAHHRHAPGSEGARCVACHMPATTYMGVHERHDHSLRVPRPDRTPTLAVPNACAKCHADKSPAWAADAVRSWGVAEASGFQSFAEAFDLADRDGPGARSALAGVAEDKGQSFIARASALARLARAPTRESVALAARALAIDDPMIRVASISILSGADAETRRKTLVPLLGDATRLVRMEAARALAGDAESDVPPEERARFETSLNDYVEAQHFNAERPESHANLGALHAARGEAGVARAEYEKALAIDRTFFPAAIALGEVMRADGDEAGAESILRQALAASPGQGALRHALGLSLVRQARLDEALAELAAAARQAPEDPRFAYVYAVALHDTGQPQQALDVLKDALARAPNDREILLALASYEVEAGDQSSALEHAAWLARLEPDDEEAQQFWRALQDKAK
jgi:Flp pilus assembly protein TadD